MNATESRSQVVAPEVKVLNAILEIVGDPDRYKQQLADFAKARAEADQAAQQAISRLAEAQEAERRNHARDEELLARDRAQRLAESQLWQRQQEHKRMSDATDERARQVDVMAAKAAQATAGIEQARATMQQALDSRQADLDKREQALSAREVALDTRARALSTLEQEHNDRVAALRKLLG